MNDLDTELETAIRSALVTDASRAPRPAPQWDGLAQYTSGAVSRRRSPWIAAAAVGLAAAAIGGAVGLRSTPSPQVVQTAGFVPAGTEFPLVDLGRATQSIQGGSITTDGLSRKVSVPGLDSLTVERTLIYGNGPTAEVAECFSPGTFGFCSSEKMGSPFPEVLHDSGQTISNGVPDPPFDYAVWTNVPTDATFVSFTGGGQQLWQRPVAGLAVFPTVGVMTAYRADGSEVQPDLVRSGGFDFGERYDVSDAQGDELRLLTNSATASCLTAHGGTIAGESAVAVFDPSVDQVEVWDSCVIETKKIVAERLAAMNPVQVKTS
jgi:hypothetical protein